MIDPNRTCGTCDLYSEAIRARLLAAYPFGERSYWPYKVWLSEVARQTGRHKTPTRKAVEKAGQVSMGSMFDEVTR